MSTAQTYFKLSGNGNLGLLWFYFTMVYDWSRKSSHVYQPGMCETETNHDMVT